MRDVDQSTCLQRTESAALEMARALGAEFGLDERERQRLCELARQNCHDSMGMAMLGEDARHACADSPGPADPFARLSFAQCQLSERLLAELRRERSA